MPTFNIQRETEELGGPASELQGQVIAWQPLSEYRTTKDFGDGEGPQTNTVMRVRAYGLADGIAVDFGIRLIYWAGVRQAINEGTVVSDLHIGVLRKEEFGDGSDRTYWTLLAPKPEAAQALIAGFAAR